MLASVLPAVYYIRFSVNTTLGRLDCAAEPAMLYKKAEIHALTNSPVVDPLTRRTGAEEALSILSSGICQPWSPLGRYPIMTLHSIVSLSPKREYYPENMRLMSRETWNPDLPTSTQREEYQTLINRILVHSTRLSSFSPTTVETSDLTPSGNLQLNQRALMRRQLHRRHNGLSLPPPTDTVYEARDRPCMSSRKHANVVEITSLIRERPSSMSTVTDLAVQLSQSLLIKGYTQAFNKTTLSDRLDIDVRQNWGPLVQVVTEIADQYSLMFFLGAISFRGDESIPLIRVLVAIHLYNELRSPELPKAVEYHSFRPRQVPQLDVLIKLIQNFKTPAPEVSCDFSYSSRLYLTLKLLL